MMRIERESKGTLIFVRCGEECQAESVRNAGLRWLSALSWVAGAEALGCPGEECLSSVVAPVSRPVGRHQNRLRRTRG